MEDHKLKNYRAGVAIALALKMKSTVERVMPLLDDHEHIIEAGLAAGTPFPALGEMLAAEHEEAATDHYVLTHY